jgi:hypothetical protein
MTNPITTLQTDLNTLATVSGTTATPTTALTTAQEVLWLLADPTVVGTDIGPAVSQLYKTIGDAINNDVVVALNGIVNQLDGILSTATELSDAQSALNALQNALQTAQSLVPGNSSAVASAFASTAQFATLFNSLLSVPGTDATQATGTLSNIALQLGAVASAFTTAPPTP